MLWVEEGSASPAHLPLLNCSIPPLVISSVISWARGEGKPPGDGFLPQSPLSNALIMLNYLGHMLGVRGGARPSIRHTVTQ